MPSFAINSHYTTYWAGKTGDGQGKEVGINCSLEGGGMAVLSFYDKEKVNELPANAITNGIYYFNYRSEMVQSVLETLRIGGASFASDDNNNLIGGVASTN